MNIYLIRHGETDWNLQGRLQGREDIPLNDRGLRQANECGKALRHAKVEIIVSSPLMRAANTASIISDILGIGSVIIDQDLIERDFGPLSGMTYETSKYFDTFGSDDNLEPLENVSKRFIKRIHYYANKYPNQNIAMVSHGGAINAVLSVLTKKEAGTGKTRLKNACISILTYECNNIKLDSFNLSAEEFKDKLKGV